MRGSVTRGPAMRGRLPQRGASRWVRPLLYALLLVLAQSLFTRLADGAGVPAPDLFLLTGAALAWRLPPTWALVAAYGVGLGQDLLGGGMLGLHAAGVCGGALLVLLVRRYVADSGIFQTLLTVLAATLGAWAAYLLLTYWLRATLVTADMLVTTLPLGFALTLLAYPLWERLVLWGMGPRATSEENLT